MDQHSMMDFLALSRRRGNLLSDTLDLSRQLGEALDRDDQVSVRMLVSMRAEPIAALRQNDQALQELRNELPDPKDRERVDALLHGAPPMGEREESLAAQVAANTKRLHQVQELEERLNPRLTREKSVYQKAQTA